MGIEIKFFGDDPVALRAEMAAFLAAAAPAEAPRVFPDFTTPAKSAELDDELNDPIPDLGASSAAPANPVTKDDVRKRMIALLQTKGEETVQALILDNFGVSKVGAIKETDYARAIALAEAAIRGD